MSLQLLMLISILLVLTSVESVAVVVVLSSVDNYFADVGQYFVCYAFVCPGTILSNVSSITSVDNAAWPALVPRDTLGRGVYFRFNSDQEKREFVVEGVFYVAIQTTSWFEPCMTKKLILRPSLL